MKASWNAKFLQSIYYIHIDCLDILDIEEIIGEKFDIKNIKKYKIISEKLLIKLQNTFKKFPKKFENYLKFAQFIGTIIGFQTNIINEYLTIYNFNKHLMTCQKLSHEIMSGLMAKNLIISVLHGNIPEVAMNLGFIGWSMAAPKIASKIATATSSNFLKLFTPFIGRAATAFVIYDLIKQVQAYNNGNKEALVSIVADSIIITLDGISIGIEMAGAVGILSSASVSTVVTPLGLLSAVIFLSVDIYKSTQTVAEINNKIRLTAFEDCKTFALAFIGLEPEDYIISEINEVDLNNRLVENAIEFLKNNTKIQKYIFPSSQPIKKFKREKCQLLNPKIKYIDPGFGAGYRFDKDCFSNTNIDSKKLILDGYRMVNLGYKHSNKLDNQIDLREKLSNLYLSRTNPNIFTENLICLMNSYNGFLR